MKGVRTIRGGSSTFGSKRKAPLKAIVIIGVVLLALIVGIFVLRFRAKQTLQKYGRDYTRLFATRSFKANRDMPEDFSVLSFNALSDADRAYILEQITVTVDEAENRLATVLLPNYRQLLTDQPVLEAMTFDDSERDLTEQAQQHSTTHECELVFDRLRRARVAERIGFSELESAIQDQVSARQTLLASLPDMIKEQAHADLAAELQTAGVSELLHEEWLTFDNGTTFALLSLTGQGNQKVLRFNGASAKVSLNLDDLNIGGFSLLDLSGDIYALLPFVREVTDPQRGILIEVTEEGFGSVVDVPYFHVATSGNGHYLGLVSTTAGAVALPMVETAHVIFGFAQQERAAAERTTQPCFLQWVGDRFIDADGVVMDMSELRALPSGSELVAALQKIGLILDATRYPGDYIAVNIMRTDSSMALQHVLLRVEDDTLHLCTPYTFDDAATWQTGGGDALLSTVLEAGRLEPYAVMLAGDTCALNLTAYHDAFARFNLSEIRKQAERLANPDAPEEPPKGSGEVPLRNKILPAAFWEADVQQVRIPYYTDDSDTGELLFAGVVTVPVGQHAPSAAQGIAEPASSESPAGQDSDIAQ